MPAYVNVPGLSGLKDAANAFKENVNPFDVLLGVGVGLVAGAVFKQVVDTKLTVAAAGGTATLDASQGLGKFVSTYSASLGSAGAGLALFAAQKGNKRAAGHLVGAVGAAVVPMVAAAVSAKLIEAIPSLHGYYVQNPYGMIANDGAYGMIADDPAYGRFGMIANDPAYGLIQQGGHLGTAYVQLPGQAMSELRAVSHQIGEEADEYMV